MLRKAGQDVTDTSRLLGQYLVLHPATAIVQVYGGDLGGMSLADLTERWRLEVAIISLAFREEGLVVYPRAEPLQLLARCRREQVIDEVLRRFAELKDIEATATRTPAIMVRRYLAERRTTSVAVSSLNTTGL